MASNNPFLKRAMASGFSQGEVDSEFQRITEGGNTAPMTIEGTSAKTFGLFLIVLATAAISWITGLGVLLAFPAMFVGLGLGLWASFSKKVRPGLYAAYAAVQGVFLAGITSILEYQFPGIAINAVTATMVTAGVVFAGYRYNIIKVTSRARRIMTYALLGYLGFGLINLGFAVFTGSSAYNTQFGWLIALAGVGLASYVLAMDFDMVAVGVRERMPVENEWRAAFGLTASLVWLYVEILRLLSLLRRE